MKVSYESVSNLTLFRDSGIVLVYWNEKTDSTNLTRSDSGYT
jgi:hypothetical protein